MKRIPKFISLASILILLTMTNTSCVSAKKDKSSTTTQTTSRANDRHNGGDRPEPPKFSELLKKMDINKDDKLSQAEVDDRLKRDFSKIDKNNDGFLTEDEMTGPPQRRGRRN